MNVSVGLKMIFRHGGKKSTLFKLLIMSNEVKRDELTLAVEFCIKCEAGLDKPLRWIPSQISLSGID